MKSLATATLAALVATTPCLAQSGPIELLPHNSERPAAVLRIGPPTNEVVWTEDRNSNSCLFDVRIENFEPYANASLLAAKRLGDDLFAVFELKLDKANLRVEQLFEMLHGLTIPNEYQNWDGRFLVVRKFHRDPTGAWQASLTFFPSTMWRSVINAKVRAIEVTSPNEFCLVFAEKWRMELRDSNWRAVKVIVDPAGETRMRFQFQESSQLLLVAGEDGIFRYIGQSVLWLGFDEWDVTPFNQVNERHEQEVERHRKMQELGLPGGINTRF